MLFRSARRVQDPKLNMRMTRLLLRLSWVGLLCTAGASGLAAPASKAAVPFDFQRDIRPILSDKCFACHGPDEKERKGGKKGVGLRLDTAEGISADLGDGRRAVVSGQPDKSLLLQRVTTKDADDLMPPKKFGKPDRKSTRLNSSHSQQSRMPSSA